MKHLLIILISICYITKIYSHPHMFVDVGPKILGLENGKIQVEVVWYFDEFTSEKLFRDGVPVNPF